MHEKVHVKGWPARELDLSLYNLIQQEGELFTEICFTRIPKLTLNHNIFLWRLNWMTLVGVGANDGTDASRS